MSGLGKAEPRKPWLHVLGACIWSVSESGIRRKISLSSDVEFRKGTAGARESSSV
jgi:hypothetical protein